MLWAENSQQAPGQSRLTCVGGDVQAHCRVPTPVSLGNERGRFLRCDLAGQGSQAKPASTFISVMRALRGAERRDRDGDSSSGSNSTGTQQDVLPNVWSAVLVHPSVRTPCSCVSLGLWSLSSRVLGTWPCHVCMASLPYMWPGVPTLVSGISVQNQLAISKNLF